MGQVLGPHRADIAPGSVSVSSGSNTLIAPPRSAVLGELFHL